MIVPSTELDTLLKIIDWNALRKIMHLIKGDYDVVSRFKILLLQTWHHLSDEGIAQALQRDLVFMRFCGFSIDGKKPDNSIICRFRNRVNTAGLQDKLLAQVNSSLETQGLKISNGKYATADATLISRARCPRKHVPPSKAGDDTDQVEEAEYSDDVDAKWVSKGKKQVYG